VQLFKTNSNILVSKLLSLPKHHHVCILDSCGIGNLGSHLLICGINPIETFEITNNNPNSILELLDITTSSSKIASIFTLSYDFGLKLHNLTSRFPETNEPDVFLATFDNLIVHDYDTNDTQLLGNPGNYDELQRLLALEPTIENDEHFESNVTSTDSRETYVKKIQKIHEFIRRGDTYQVNLTQQVSAEMPPNLSPQAIYSYLKRNNPTPFSAFLTRENDHVVSTSPERFFRISNGRISVSPIKGTRPRGTGLNNDELLRNELISSEKDNAENVMIVDLMRNDLGRICDYGTINVDTLCELEVHPSLFHLVSTVSGELKKDVKFSEVLSALFPCGSITGCPKIRTMSIIDEIESAPRGLSMGAIGYCDFEGNIDLSVAIRTMVVRGTKAQFNVGGGIVIESNPDQEYEESLTKASALLSAINGKLK
jgi:para-aminobenzoate synthetase component I